MELLFWQSLALIAIFTAVLAVVVMGGVIFADHATYRRGR